MEVETGAGTWHGRRRRKTELIAVVRDTLLGDGSVSGLAVRVVVVRVVVVRELGEPSVRAHQRLQRRGDSAGREHHEPGRRARVVDGDEDEAPSDRTRVHVHALLFVVKLEAPLPEEPAQAPEGAHPIRDAPSEGRLVDAVDLAVDGEEPRAVDREDRSSSRFRSQRGDVGSHLVQDVHRSSRIADRAAVLEGALAPRRRHGHSVETVTRAPPASMRSRSAPLPGAPIGSSIMPSIGTIAGSMPCRSMRPAGTDAR